MAVEFLVPAFYCKACVGFHSPLRAYFSYSCMKMLIIIRYSTICMAISYNVLMSYDYLVQEKVRVALYVQRAALQFIDGIY